MIAYNPTRSRINTYAPAVNTSVNTASAYTNTAEQNVGGFLGGLGYLGEKIGLGALSWAEGVADFIGAGFSSLIGREDWAEDILANDWVNYNDADEWFNPSDGWKMAGDVAQGIGNSIPSIATTAVAAYFTGGLSLGAQAGLTFVTSGLSASGRGVKEAYRETGTLGGKEWMYGIGVGALEGGVEAFSDNVLGLGTGVIKQAFGRNTAKALVRDGIGKTLIKSFTGEALEEGVSEFFTPYIKRATYDAQAENASIGDIAYASLIGGLSGMVMGGVHSAVGSTMDTIHGAKISQDPNKVNSTIETARSIVDTESQVETESDAFARVRETLSELDESLKTTNGEAVTLKQKRLLGELQNANTVAVFQPMIWRQGASIVQNAEQYAAALNQFFADNQTGEKINVTAEELTKGIDFSSKRKFRKTFQKALKENIALRTVTVYEVANRLSMDTEQYAQAFTNGTMRDEMVTQDMINRFAENGTDLQIKSVQDTLGIEDLRTATADEVNAKLAEFVRNGGAQRVADNNAAIKSILADETIKTKNSIPKTVRMQKDGTTRYTQGGVDIAIVKNGETFRVYDYTDNVLSREMTREEAQRFVNKVRAEAEKTMFSVQNNEQNGTEAQEAVATEETTETEQTDVQNKTAEIDDYAKREIKEYNKLSEPNKRAVRFTIRQAIANGVSEEETIRIARVAARSGLNIVFDKEPLFIKTSEDGTDLYADAMYRDGTVYLNRDKSENKTYTALLTHEMMHALFKEQNGRMQRKLVRDAIRNLPKAKTEEWAKQYKGVGYTAAQFMDELVAKHAEIVLGDADVWEYILSEDASKKNKVLSFFSKAAQDYSADEVLSRSARKLLTQYRKMFNQLADRTQGSNADRFAKTNRSEERGDYSFAGETAKTADNTMLSKAKEMLTNGSDPETIRKETGWFEGYDKKWRFEIDDSKSELNIPEYFDSDYGIKLSKILNHEELLKAYPFLNDVDVFISNTVPHGAYVPSGSVSSIGIYALNNNRSTKWILIHEIQHLIQNYEKFATGASPKQFSQIAWGEKEYKAYDKCKEAAEKLYNVLKRNGIEIDKSCSIGENEILYNEVDKNISDNYMLLTSLADRNKRTSNLLEEYYDNYHTIYRTTPNGQYNAVAGEIEAYDTQARMEMTAEERKNTRPNIDRTDVVFADAEKSFFVAKDNNGNNVAVVTDNVFYDKSVKKHQAIANNIAKNIGKYYPIIESGQNVYIGKDLPNEYTQSEYTKHINAKLRKAKGLSSSNIGEMIEIASDRKWVKNRKQKHNIDAKYGWYHYTTRFAIPVYDSFGKAVNFKVYTADLIIRNDADGKKYLYDIQDIKQESSSNLPAPLVDKVRNIRSNSLDSSISENNQNVNPSATKKFSLPETNNNSSKGKIKIGMTDDERIAVLKNKKLSLSAKTDYEKLDSAMEKLDITDESIEYTKYGDRVHLFKKLGEEFGVYKKYANKDIEIEFEFSKGKMQESVNKQRMNYLRFAKMLTCIDDIVNNAIGIEAHNRNKDGYKVDPNLIQCYVLASAFVDGKSIVPVKLEIKELSGQKNTLHVAIALESIKMDGIVTQGTSQSEVAKQYAPPSNISILDFLQKINPSDESFYKYIPKATAKNTGDVYSLPDSEIKSTANQTQKKVYTKAETQAIINSVLEDTLSDGDEYLWMRGKLSGKSNRKILQYLFEKMNTTPEGKRQGVAIKAADYIVENAFMREVFNEEAPNDEELERAKAITTLIGAYRHKIDMSSIIDEINTKYDAKAKTILAQWKVKEGTKGFSADQIKQSLAELGISIKSENEADIFFDILDQYAKARETLNYRKREISLKEYGSEEDIKALKNEIAVDIMKAFEERGDESWVSKKIQDYESRITALSENLKFEKETHRIENRIADAAKKLGEFAKRKYVSASELSNPAITAWLKQISKLEYRGNVRTKSARATAASFGDIYNIDNTNLFETKVNGEWTNTGLIVPDDQVFDAISHLKSRAESNEKLTAEDLRAIMTVIGAARHLFENYNSVVVNNRNVNLTEFAKNGVDILAKTKSPKKMIGLFSKVHDYFRMIVEPRVVLKELEHYDENGALTQAFKQITEAESKAHRQFIAWMNPFDRFLEQNKGYKKRLSNYEIEINGKKMTVGQAISLYETSKREQAKDGLYNSGITFIDENGKKVSIKLTEQDIQSIKKQFTAEDEKFIGLIDNFFNNDSKNAKIAADEKILGYSNVLYDFYYPIKRDSGTIAKSITDIRAAISEIQNAYSYSFNKSVREGAQNALFIGNAWYIVSRHADQLSIYCNMTVPMQAFDRIYNKNVGDKNNVITIRDTIKSNLWDGADDYIRNLMNDIQGVGKDNSGFNKVLSDVRRQFAKFQLGANLKVILSQTASFPTAGVILDADVLAKSLKMRNRADTRAEMDKYCDYAMVRNYTQEIVKAEGVLDKVSKVGDIMTKPIQWTDRFTIGALWNACQLQVEKDGGIKLGTEENKVEAGKLLEEVCRYTQPNYSATERSALMRSKSEIAKAFTMFTSAPLKQVSRFVECIGEMRYALSTKDNAKIKAANKKLRKAVAAIMLANAMYCLIGMGFKWLYDKDKEKDKDGNEIGFLEDYLTDIGSTTIGMFPIVNDVFGYFKDGYEISAPAYDLANDILENTKKITSLVSKAARGENVEKWEYGAALRSGVYAAGEFLGIPTRNINNTLYGLVKRFDPADAYKYNSMFTNANYARDLKNATAKGDEALAQTIFDMMMNEEKAGALSREATATVKKLYNAGYNVIPKSVGDSISVTGVNEDGETVTANAKLNAKTKKLFKAEYGKATKAVESLTSDRSFERLTEEEQAKAIKTVYDIYYDRAKIASGVTDSFSNNTSLYSEFVGADKLALAIGGISYVESEKDKIGKVISGSKKKQIINILLKQNLSDEERIFILYAKGYTLKDSEYKGMSASAVKKKLLQYILKANTSQSVKALVAEKCGFDVKNGKIITATAFNS